MTVTRSSNNEGQGASDEVRSAAADLVQLQSVAPSAKVTTTNRKRKNKSAAAAPRAKVATTTRINRKQNKRKKAKGSSSSKKPKKGSERKESCADLENFPPGQYVLSAIRFTKRGNGTAPYECQWYVVSQPTGRTYRFNDTTQEPEKHLKRPHGTISNTDLTWLRAHPYQWIDMGGNAQGRRLDEEEVKKATLVPAGCRHITADMVGQPIKHQAEGLDCAVNAFLNLVEMTSEREARLRSLLPGYKTRKTHARYVYNHML